MVSTSSLFRLGFVSSLLSAIGESSPTKATHISPSFQTRVLNDADHVNKLSTVQEPRVGISGYLYDFESSAILVTNSRGQSVGLTTKLATDIFASFESPAFMITQRQMDWLVINPHLFGEGSIWFDVTFKLLLIELTLQFKVLAFRFSPLDFQFAWDLSSEGRYCSSVGYFREMFDLRLDVSSHVYECHTGLIGMLRSNSDGTDCSWRTYSPYLPLWETTFYDQGDSVTDYVSWRCTDDSQLETQEGQESAHPHGFEPSNAPGDGGADSGDGDGIIDEWDVDGTVIVNN